MPLFSQSLLAILDIKFWLFLFCMLQALFSLQDHLIEESCLVYYHLSNLLIATRRRCLCCDDDGILLLAFSKDLKRLSNYLMPQSKKEVSLV